MLKVGEHIGEHWVVGATLGTGGTGSVFHCRHDETGIEAAVKVLRPLHPRILKRLLVRAQREAEALEALDHPGIVRVIDWGTDEQRGVFYLGMEAVDGADLDSRSFRDPYSGAPDTGRIREVFLQITDALLHAHQREVAHRDLKWQNVLMRRDGQPVIVDWGSVYVEEGERLTRFDDSGALGRTDLYAPPEAILNPLGANPYLWDVYSLGVMLYIAMTGHIGPYADTVDSHDMVVVKTAGPLDPGEGHDPQLRNLVVTATAPMPNQRPRTLETFRRLLVAGPAPLADLLTAPTTPALSTSMIDDPASEATAMTWEPADERAVASGTPPATEPAAQPAPPPEPPTATSVPKRLPASASSGPDLRMVAVGGVAVALFALVATVGVGSMLLPAGDGGALDPTAAVAPQAGVPVEPAVVEPAVVEPAVVEPAEPQPGGTVRPVEPPSPQVQPPSAPVAAPSPVPEPTPAPTSPSEPDDAVADAVEPAPEAREDGLTAAESARRTRLVDLAEASPDRMVARLAQDPAAVAQLVDDLSTPSPDETGTRMTNRTYQRLLLGMQGAPADGARIARAAANQGRLDAFVRISRAGQGGDFQLPVLQVIASQAPENVRTPASTRDCRTLTEYVDLIGRPQVVAGAPWIRDACAACAAIEGAPTGKCEDIDAQ